MLPHLNDVIKKMFAYPQSAIWCFTFHQVAEEYVPGMHLRGTFTPMRMFEKYTRYLKKHFELVSVSTALELQKSKTFKGKYACISFDDGDKSIENIIPYLLSEQVPASFFLNSAYIESKLADPFRTANYLLHHEITDSGKERLRRLTDTMRRTMLRADFQKAREELRTLQGTIPAGELNFYVGLNFLQTINSPLIHFGLHGHEHDRFILMDYEEQKESLSQNMRFVSRLNGSVPVFAIPFGRPWDWNGITMDVSSDLRLDFLFSNGGINTGDGIGLQRIPADNRNLLLDMRLGYYQ